MSKIIGIAVSIEKLGYRTNIYYHVMDNTRHFTWYNVYNVPDNIMQLVNKNRPVKSYETVYPDINTIVESIIYKF